ncbi:hypothetical protein FSPOR_5284 [Fusarium sporotrichioides]|uniref:Uncharacterized protein n=1 Tax=Fusarium sporotrichioides TaxID=5514 RepID=A0A395S838_FUSSP|nr:hypothetical protein FSPOR_5284 [Fusarium sporotrichioides]
MDSRDKGRSREEKSSPDYRGALTTKSPEHVYHGSGPGHLINLSGIEGASAQQSNAFTQGGETRMNPTSMKEFLAIQEARMDSFLQHSEKQAEAQRSALRQITDHLGGIVASLGSTVVHWLGHPAAHQGEHLHKELSFAHARFIDFQGQYQQLKIDHQTLQKELQEANTKLAKAIEEQNEQRKLADIANWTGAAKLSDDAIRSKWKCQIKCPTDEVNKAQFGSIVSCWPKLLENDDYKELLITAYLWALVDEEVFQNGNKFWGGGLICALKRTRARLVELAPEADRPSQSGPTMRHVAKWSAQGTSLLNHFYGRDKKAPKMQAIDTLDRLRQFCNIAEEKAGTDFLQEMKGIIETALNLDEMLMGSIAILSIQWPETGQSKSLRYDEHGMDAVAHTKDLSPRTAVAFTISPMLLKTGNANGCNYDSEMVLCKASVVFQGPAQHQVLEWSGRDDICTDSGQLNCNGGILYTMYM